MKLLLGHTVRIVQARRDFILLTCRCVLQDIVFGFKATELFQVSDASMCNTAARQIGNHVTAVMAQAREGTAVFPASLSPAMTGELSIQNTSCLHRYLASMTIESLRAEG